MAAIGKLLIVLAVVLAVAGAGFLTAGRFGWPRLPGDLEFRRGNTTFYFPIATSIILSVVLTLVLSFLVRRR